MSYVNLFSLRVDYKTTKFKSCKSNMKCRLRYTVLYYHLFDKCPPLYK